MSSELQKQVSSLRKKHVLSTGVHEGRPSLFLSASEAAQVDVKDIHEAACRALETLAQYDSRLYRFMESLLDPSSINLQRELKTSEESKLLDKELEALLRLLSVFALEQPCHLVLEYLIRRYRVHEMNADALLKCMISAHDTKVFAKVVQLSTIEGTIWDFLHGVKVTGVPLPRPVLVSTCWKQTAVLESIAKHAQLVLTGHIRSFASGATEADEDVEADEILTPVVVQGARRLLNLFTSVVLEMSLKRSFDDAKMRSIYAFLVGGLRHAATVSVRSGGNEERGELMSEWTRSCCVIIAHVSLNTGFGNALTTVLVQVLLEGFMAQSAVESIISYERHRSASLSQQLLVTVVVLTQKQAVSIDGSMLALLFRDIQNAAEAAESDALGRQQLISDSIACHALVLMLRNLSAHHDVSLFCRALCDALAEQLMPTPEFEVVSVNPAVACAALCALVNSGIASAPCVVHVAHRIFDYVMDPHRPREQDQEQEGEVEPGVVTSLEELRDGAIRCIAQRYAHEFDWCMKAYIESLNAKRASASTEERDDTEADRSATFRAYLGRIFAQTAYKIPDADGLGLLMMLNSPLTQLKIQGLQSFASEESSPSSVDRMEEESKQGLAEAACASLFSREESVALAAWRPEVLSRIVGYSYSSSPSSEAAHELFAALTTSYSYWTNQSLYSAEGGVRVLQAIWESLADPAVLQCLLSAAPSAESLAWLSPTDRDTAYMTAAARVEWLFEHITHCALGALRAQITRFASIGGGKASTSDAADASLNSSAMLALRHLEQAAYRTACVAGRHHMLHMFEGLSGGRTEMGQQLDTPARKTKSHKGSSSKKVMATASSASAEESSATAVSMRTDFLACVSGHFAKDSMVGIMYYLTKRAHESLIDCSAAPVAAHPAVYEAVCKAVACLELLSSLTVSVLSARSLEEIQEEVEVGASSGTAAGAWLQQYVPLLRSLVLLLTRFFPVCSKEQQESIHRALNVLISTIDLGSVNGSGTKAGSGGEQTDVFALAPGKLQAISIAQTEAVVLTQLLTCMSASAASAGLEQSGAQAQSTEMLSMALGALHPLTQLLQSSGKYEVPLLLSRIACAQPLNAQSPAVHPTWAFTADAEWKNARGVAEAEGVAGKSTLFVSVPVQARAAALQALGTFVASLPIPADSAGKSRKQKWVPLASDLDLMLLLLLVVMHGCSSQESVRRGAAVGLARRCRQFLKHCTGDASFSVHLLSKRDVVKKTMSGLVADQPNSLGVADFLPSPAELAGAFQAFINSAEMIALDGSAWESALQTLEASPSTSSAPSMMMMVAWLPFVIAAIMDQGAMPCCSLLLPALRFALDRSSAGLEACWVSVKSMLQQLLALPASLSAEEDTSRSRELGELVSLLCTPLRRVGSASSAPALQVDCVQWISSILFPTTSPAAAQGACYSLVRAQLLDIIGAGLLRPLPEACKTVLFEALGEEQAARPGGEAVLSAIAGLGMSASAIARFLHAESQAFAYRFAALAEGQLPASATRASASPILRDADVDADDHSATEEEEDEDEEYSLRGDSRHLFGMSTAVKRLSACMETARSLLDAASNDASEGDVLLLCAVAGELLDALKILNDPRLRGVSALSYCKSFVVDVLLGCMQANPSPAALVLVLGGQPKDAPALSLTHPGCRGSAGVDDSHKGKAKNNKAKKGNSKGSKHDMDSSAADSVPRYQLQRIPADIVTLLETMDFSCVSGSSVGTALTVNSNSSLAENTQSEARRSRSTDRVLGGQLLAIQTSVVALLHILVELSPGSVVPSITAFGSLLSRSTAILQGSLSTAIESVLRSFLSFLPVESIEGVSGVGSVGSAAGAAQALLQAFCADLQRISHQRRLQLMKIFVRAVAGQRAHLPCITAAVGTLLTHCVAAHELESRAVSGVSGSTAQEADTAPSSERADADSLVLLSKSAQRKALRDTKLNSASQDMFRLSTELVLGNLSGAPASANSRVDHSSVVSKREPGVAPSLMTLHTLIEMVNYAHALLRYACTGHGSWSAEVGAGAGAVGLEDLCSFELRELSAQRSLLYLQRILEEASAAGPGPALSSSSPSSAEQSRRGSSATMAALVMEFVSEVLSNRSFHRQLSLLSAVQTAKSRPAVKHGSVRAGGMRDDNDSNEEEVEDDEAEKEEEEIDPEREAQLLFFALADSMVELMTFGSELESGIGRHTTLTAHSGEQVQSKPQPLLPLLLRVEHEEQAVGGTRLMRVSAQAVGAKARAWCFSGMETLQQLMDTPTFLGMLQALIGHEKAAVRQNALLLLGKRLEVLGRVKAKDAQEVQLYVDLSLHLRSVIQESVSFLPRKAAASSPTVDSEANGPKGSKHALLGLAQAALMCVDVLSRYLGKQKLWVKELMGTLGEVVDLAEDLCRCCGISLLASSSSSNDSSSSTSISSSSSAEDAAQGMALECMKLLGSVFLCGGTLCNVLGAVALPKLSGLMRALLGTLDSVGSSLLLLGELRTALLGDSAAEDEGGSAKKKKHKKSTSLTLSVSESAEALMDPQHQRAQLLAQVLLVRCGVASLSLVVMGLPSFFHPYVQHALTALFRFNQISRNRTANLRILLRSPATAARAALLIPVVPDERGLESDIDSCLSKISSSLPPRLIVPTLAESTASIFHSSQVLAQFQSPNQSQTLLPLDESWGARLSAHSAAARFAAVLGEVFSQLDRGAVLVYLPQLTSISMLLLDYRRVFGGSIPLLAQSSSSFSQFGEATPVGLIGEQEYLEAVGAVDAAGAQAVVELCLKLTETELKAFLARLGEWRDQFVPRSSDGSILITHGSHSNSSSHGGEGGDSAETNKKVRDNVFSRAVGFYAVVEALGVRLQGLFNPAMASLWEGAAEWLRAVKDCVDQTDVRSLRKQALLASAAAVGAAAGGESEGNADAVALSEAHSGSKKRKHRLLEAAFVSTPVATSSAGGEREGKGAGVREGLALGRQETRLMELKRMQDLVLVAESVLSCVCHTCVLSTDDNSDFVNEHRFQLMAPSVLALLPMRSAFPDKPSYASFAERCLLPCISALARAAQSDTLWKPLNHQLLLFTRDGNAAVRVVAIKALHKLFSEVGEEYLLLLPECLPFLSELLEDGSKEVVQLTAETIRFVEDLSGEKLDEYLQ